MNDQNVKAMIFELDSNVYRRWLNSLILHFGEEVEEEIFWRPILTDITVFLERFSNLQVIVLGYHSITMNYSLPGLAEDLKEKPGSPPIILVDRFPSYWVDDFRDRYSPQDVFHLWECDLAAKMAGYINAPFTATPVH